MIQELDDVVLTVDIPGKGLASGDLGTAVLVHDGGAGYEVELTAVNGDTVAVVTLSAGQVRQVRSDEIAHVREFALK
jgi:hypothetical protein